MKASGKRDILTNTQFIGGMHYVFRESIYPFDPYRLVSCIEHTDSNMVGINK
jgi:hypothetical protein